MTRLTGSFNFRHLWLHFSASPRMHAAVALMVLHAVGWMHALAVAPWMHHINFGERHIWLECNQCPRLKFTTNDTWHELFTQLFYH